MSITTNFAAAIAVTIPVLMLAGGLELQNLANSVSERTVDVAEKSLARFVDFLKAIAKRRTGAAGLRDDFRVIIQSYAATSPLASVGLFLLPVIWLGTLVLSVISELACLLYLATVHVPPSTPILSVIAVGLLMTLLIVTPAFRTFFSAPRSGYREFVKKLVENPPEPLLKDMMEITELAVAAGRLSSEQGQGIIERLQSRLNDIAQREERSSGSSDLPTGTVGPSPPPGARHCSVLDRPPWLTTWLPAVRKTLPGAGRCL